ncbi:hypothetical protein C8J56DRAFT_560513 [Mycena floridula]|nr:hypothetical protein C8J56DRAFT_560513 [Mycena floridula]
MDNLATTVDIAPGSTPEPHSDAQPSKISAYYSLVFPDSTFYIQTLSITIGRRCNPATISTSTASSSAAPETSQVDVDLGALKSVSRLHAKIEYDADDDRFVLVVLGRNGAWVDGVWSGSGTRAPLGERSQIQIASRIFHFVLPPPPPPDEAPSPSSQSSANRPRSPSLDVTSISPPSSLHSHSPPPRAAKVLPPTPEPQISVVTPTKPAKVSNSKKRKKSDVAEAPPPPSPIPRPKPEDMPPKPAFTYAQLIYRAIKGLGGKATLQEICSWIMNEYDYYRYSDGTAWSSSVRHNLSSSSAFKKMERCGGDRGKGYFWSLDEEHVHNLEGQEAKAKAQSSTAQATGGKDAVKRPKKEKGTPASEPALKRSMKADSKTGILPPPLTSAPLIPKTTSFSPATTGVFAYNSHPHHTVMPASSSIAATGTSGYSTAASSTANPYSVLTQGPWGAGRPAAAAPVAPPTPSTPSTLRSTASTTTVSSSQSVPKPQEPASSVPDVFIPIILGPIPPSHPDYVADKPNNSLKQGYMILHERKLILDPDIFAGLSPERLADLEKMGARQALVVLTGHMVRALKEKRAKGRKGARTKSKAARPGDANPSVATSPATGSKQVTDPTESEIVVVVDDDDGPALKKRKVDSLPSVL